jgi:hypothetical protein
MSRALALPKLWQLGLRLLAANRGPLFFLEVE